jgi:hypothetical protein
MPSGLASDQVVDLPDPLVIPDEDLPETPVAIRKLPDPFLRARAAEVWVAAVRLVRALDLCHNWIAELRKVRGRPDLPGPHPGIHAVCDEAARRFIQAICLSGVRADPFDRLPSEQVMALLPPWPHFRTGGRRFDFDPEGGRLVESEEPRWQDDPAFWGRWHSPGADGRTGLDRFLALRGAACQLQEAFRSLPALLFPAGPTAGPAPHPGPSPEKQATARERKGKNVDARILKKLEEDPESLWWPARKWARVLGCHYTTVIESRTWKQRILVARAIQAVERVGRTGQLDGGRRRKSG